MSRWYRLIIIMTALLVLPPVAAAETPALSPSEQITTITNQTVSRVAFIKRHSGTDTKNAQLVRRQAVDAITDAVNDYVWTAEENQVKLPPKQKAEIEYEAQAAVNTIELLYRDEIRNNPPGVVNDAAALPLPPLTAVYAKTHRPFLPSSPLSHRTMYEYPERVSPLSHGFWSVLGLTVAGILGTQSLFVKPATLTASLYNPNDQTVYSLDIESKQGKEQAIPISFSNNWRSSDLAPGEYQIRYHGVEQSYNLTIGPNEVWCLALPQPPVKCY